MFNLCSKNKIRIWSQFGYDHESREIVQSTLIVNDELSTKQCKSVQSVYLGYYYWFYIKCVYLLMPINKAVNPFFEEL